MLGRLFSALGIRVDFKAGRKLVDLECDLAPVEGAPVRGEIEYARWVDGARRMEVKLRGLSSNIASLHVDGVHAMEIGLVDGFIDYTFDSSRGEIVPTLIEGARIEIFDNGVAILSGVLRRD